MRVVEITGPSKLCNVSRSVAIPQGHRFVPRGQEQIIVANLGSTSVKMELHQAAQGLLATGATKGNIPKGDFGDASCVFNLRVGEATSQITGIKTHEDALRAFVRGIRLITDNGAAVQTVFYKTVAGGTERKGVCVMDEATLVAMGRTNLLLAREHNEFYTLGAEILERLLPDAIHLGRFETATHINNRLESLTTSLPFRLADALGLDATGFHGAAIAYLVERGGEMLRELGITNSPERLVGFHIGGSSSAFCSLKGQVVETSMQGTPESGFPQGARITGADVNPLMVEFIVDKMAGLIYRYFHQQIMNCSGWLPNAFIQGINALVDSAFRELINNGTLNNQPVVLEEQVSPPEVFQGASLFENLAYIKAVRERTLRMLTQESGLSGIAGSGTGGDVEKIRAAAAQGNKQCQLAYDVLVYKARGYLFNYIGQLGGVDAIIFSAGTGENDPEFRARVIGDGNLSFGGTYYPIMVLDATRNSGMVGGQEGLISMNGSPVPIFVIKSNEAKILIRDCLTAYRQIAEAAGQ